MWLAARETSVGRHPPDPVKRTVIIEDHRMFAEVMALGLRLSGMQAGICPTDDEGKIVGCAKEQDPDLILLGLQLGALDGLTLIPPLRTLGAEILVVTGCKDESRLAAAVALGACGWVSKTEPFGQLVEACTVAAEHRPLIGPGRLEELVSLGRLRLRNERELEQRMTRLTYREQEVLAALEQGLTAGEIADDFVVSVATVRTHIRAILSKLGVSNQMAAVAKASHRVPLGREFRISDPYRA